MGRKETAKFIAAEEYKQLEERIAAGIDFAKLNELCTHLRDALVEILKSCGLYFRIFARVKSPKSIAKKILEGNYGTPENPKKIQDLIGLRIVFYYHDDMSICRNIMESTFQMIDDWSMTKYKSNEFKPTKTNGVFRFPFEYFKYYKRPLWDFPIDTTFEIQFRTVFFEGWHEIEHDMRYKSRLSDHEFWEDSEDLSRILSCVLANLELSDWSLVKLFDELSYNHYKNKNWELMLKSKYRLHIENEPLLDPAVTSLLNEDTELAKAFFKADRKTLIIELLKLGHARITYNQIVRLINEREIGDTRLTKIFADIEQERQTSSYAVTPLAPLQSEVLFHIDLPILHKESRNLESEFHNAISSIYKWVRFKVNPIFKNMPEEPCAYSNNMPGYYFTAEYNPEHFYFETNWHYMDNQSVGTLWHLNTIVSRTEDGNLHLYHHTSRHMPKGVTNNITFSKPYFLADLSKKVGIVDIVRLGSKAKFVKNEDSLKELIHLIHHPKRLLPVVVITQDDVLPSEQSSENWVYDMNTFTINGTRLAKVVGHYCHVYMTDKKYNSTFADSFSLNKEEAAGCIAIFWQPERHRDYELYTKKIVSETQFDFNRFAFHEDNLCEKAFRHKLVQIIKDDNVS